MIIRPVILACDSCKREIRITTLGHESDIANFQEVNSWYTVMTQEPSRHFCNLLCLKSWVDSQVLKTGQLRM